MMKYLLCLIVILGGSTAFGYAASQPVGSANGALTVGANGGAEYTMPIEVPPGTAGVQPHLALVYSNQQGNGLLGVGWNIAGLQAITRCAKTKAQDNQIGGINLDANDRFCLDGERLVAISGVYGADNTVYHTEHESWSKIISHGSCGTGPCWFDVTSKNGVKMEFANTADSRIEAKGASTVLVWALNKVTDINQNYLTVAYTDDQTNGEYYPLQISYTGNSATAKAAGLSVNFVYQTRTDDVTHYVAGSAEKRAQRLQSITTKVGAQLIKQYKIGYEYGTSTGRSRVKTIQECDGAATQVCLPATQFTSSEKTNAFAAEGNWGARNASNGVGDTGKRQWMADLNGDGRADYLYQKDGTNQYWALLSNGAGFNTDVQWGARANSTIGYSGKSNWVADINGDGFADYIYLYDNGSAHEMHALLGGVSGFGSDILWGARANGNNVAQNGDHNWMVDLNGDGRADYLYVRDSTTELRAIISNGSTSNVDTLWGNRNASNNVGYSGTSHWVVDVNGDGLPDYLYNRDNTGEMWVKLNTGSGFAADVLWGTRAAGNNVGLAGKLNWVADVNGDGLPDFIYTRANTNEVWVMLNTGKGFATDVKWGDRFAGNNVGFSGGAAWVGDINGDGLADLVYNRDNTREMWVMLSTGKSFGTDTNWGSRSGGVGYSGNANWMMVDVDGDGVLDYVYNPDTTKEMHVLLSQPVTGAPTPDHVVTIANGIGGSEQISYKSLAQAGGTYVKQNTAVYPQVDIQPALSVVDSRKVFSGMGTDEYDYIYIYQGAKADLNGRGWLGFNITSAIDVAANISSITYHNQQFPLVGQTTALETRLLQGAYTPLLKKTTFTYAAATNPYTGVYQQLLQNERSEHYTPNASGSSATLDYTMGKDYQFDAYANVTVEADLGDMAQAYDDIYICSAYNNDSTNWRLGYLQKTKAVPSLSGCNSLTQWNAGDLRYSQINYFPNGNIQSQQQWLDSSSSWITTSFQYDSYGNITDITDPLSNVFHTGYDATFTFPITRSTPPNQQGVQLVTSYSYDLGFGQVVSKTDANGNVFTTTLDGFGRVTQESGPTDVSSTPVVLANYTRVACPDTVNCTASTTRGMYIEMHRRHDWSDNTEANWYWQRNFVDGLAREYRSVLRSGDTGGNRTVTRATFDTQGRLSQKSLPFFLGATVPWQTYAFDSFGRPQSVTAPNSVQQTFAYSNGDRTITTTMPAPADVVGGSNTVTVSRTLDSRGRTVSSTDALGAINTTVYDRLGQVLTETDPSNIVTTLAYDSLGRRLSVNVAERGTTTFAYDANSRLLTQTDAKSQQLQYLYDKLGRVIRKTATGGTGSSTLDTVVEYTYDGSAATQSMGRLAQEKWGGRAADGSALNPTVRSFNYDRQGHITRLVTGSYVSLFSYDPLGRVRTHTFPDGAVQTNSYNLGGNLASVAVLDGGVTTQYASYSNYNALDQYQTITYGNGDTEALTFDSIGRVATDQTGASGTSLGYSYQWNNANKLRIETDTINSAFTKTLGYDNAGRMLQSATNTETKTFNFLNGNLSKQDNLSYVLDATKKHQIASGSVLGNAQSPTFYLHYDANGNVIDRNYIGPQTYTTTTPGWDETLSGGCGIVHHDGTSTSQTLIAAYSDEWFYNYDKENRLIETRKGASLISSSTVSQFSYDGRGNRTIKIDADGTGTQYVAPGYEITSKLGVFNLHTKYIVGPQGVIATQTKDNSSGAIVLISATQSFSAGLFDRIAAAWDSFMVRHPGAKLITAQTSTDGVGALLSLTLAMRLRGTRKHGLFASLRAPTYDLRAFVYLILSVFLFTTLPTSKAYADMNPGANGRGVPEVGVVYVHQNRLQTTGLVTGTNGVAQTTLHYAPYGAIDQPNSSGNDKSRPKFTGKEFDNGSELYYFGQRFYDPVIGQFLTPDPAWQYANPYSYGDGDPQSGVDPNGEFFWILIAVAVVAFSAYSSGAAVNHSMNMGKWDYASGKTWGAVIGGGIIGGLGVAAGAAAGAAIGASAVGGAAGDAAVGVTAAGVAANIGAQAVIGGVTNLATNALDQGLIHGGFHDWDKAQLGTSFGEGAAAGAVFGAVDGGIAAYRGAGGGYNRVPGEVEMAPVPAVPPRPYVAELTERSLAAANRRAEASVLMGELRQNGTKFSSDAMLAIRRDANGRIVFLERGGLNHIIDEHLGEFRQAGISSARVPDAVMSAATDSGDPVAFQGKPKKGRPARPIYELNYNGRPVRIAVTVGNNGFVVGANPSSIPQ